jgi:P-type Cu2+ transporter
MSNHTTHTHPGETSPEQGHPPEHNHHVPDARPEGHAHHDTHVMPQQQHDAHAGHEHHGSHDAHAGHGGHADVFRTTFWVSLILTIPIVLYSEMVQDWLKFSMPEFPGSGWIAPVLGTFVFFYGGMVFLRGGWDEVTQRQPGMMLLISMAIMVAFLASLATTIGWLDMDFWWELALLISIMLLGHWQETRALGQTRGALAALAELLPDTAERIVDDTTDTVAISDLATGDLVLVRPGSRVPADGIIESGAAALDESMITGESRPVERGAGDRIVAGTVVAGSSIRFRVGATGDDTALAGIQRMVADAQSSRSRAQALADRFAAALFYIATAAGAITFIVWWVLGDLDQAISRTVTVLVISCPHALGLAIPLVIAISTEVSARSGVLVKDRLALERMRTVDTVLFDKTGTLTRGNHAVADVISADGDTSAVLAQAAAVEMDSEHPLARAIVTEARERGVSIPATKEFRALAGRGVQASLNGSAVGVGGPTMLRELKLSVPDTIRQKAEAWSERGAAVLHVVRDGSVIGALALEDQVRDESYEAVAELQEQGIRVVMITGDAEPVANAVGNSLGIDEIFAQVLPDQKQDVVKTLQGRGNRVAMVGDGVNDAPALAQADVGIAIGAGTDVAIQSAGVILASSDPRLVSGVRRLSAAAYRRMVQNLGWAAGYNVIAIPLAAGVLAPIGISLSPAVGAVLMSLSTIVVALNAQILRKIEIVPERVEPS